jgi:hypothetical protein
MSILKGTLVAIALTGFAAAPAFAADGGLEDGMAWMLNIEGPSATGKMASKSMADAMKMAKPITGNVMIFRSGGKYYMIEDSKGSAYQQFRDMAPAM